MLLSKGFSLIVDKALDLHEIAVDHLRKYHPFLLVIAASGGAIVYLHVSQIYHRSELPLRKRLMACAFSHIRRLPFVQKKIAEKLEPAMEHLLNSIHQDDSDRVFITEIPAKGKTPVEVQQLAMQYDAYGHFDVDQGKVSGTVYTDRGDEHLDMLAKIYHDYAFSNPLHPDVFPGARKMEAESRGVRSPVILCPTTGHAAFDKAAHLCGMRIRHASADENNRVDVKAMERLITNELVGSSPNFPSGTVDPIADIAKLGEKYSIPVHIDACLGGFLIPFMQEAGYPIELFDFRLPGVTSISVETHKYGCTPKGSSIVMYRSQELHHHQFFSVPDWSGGIYATPTIAGSRAGANAAVAWATMLYLGKEEYVRRCMAIVESTRVIASGVEKIPGIKVLGSPDLCVVGFTSSAYNIYAVGDILNTKGYNLNALQNPDAIHICVTYNHATETAVAAFLADLLDATTAVSQLPDKGDGSATGTLYGLAAQIPDKSLVDEMAFAYLDACYALPPPKKE